MALNTLTVSLSNGIIGRQFVAAISGLTAGSVVDMANGGTQGFGYANGKLSNPGLPGDMSLAILRERLPATGETLLTYIIVTAVPEYALAQQASSMVPGYRGYRAAPVVQGDGSLLWTLFVEDMTGATSIAPVGGTVTISISGVPAAAMIGSAYLFTPATANGSGTKTFAYSGTSLAGFGLSFSAATGAITGTVSGSAGTVTGTISVTDASGTASLPISFAVSAAGGFAPSLDFSDPRNSQYVNFV